MSRKTTITILIVIALIAIAAALIYFFRGAEPKLSWGLGLLYLI